MFNEGNDACPCVSRQQTCSLKAKGGGFITD